MATYPGGLWSPTTKIDKVDLVQASHINDMQDEVVAIQTELGADVAGNKTNLLQRLAVMMATNGAIAQGSAFPTNPVEGQLFYRTDEDTPYVADVNGTWDSLLAVADGAVTQSKLSTTTGEVGSTSIAQQFAVTAVLPGGEYGFALNIKATDTALEFRGLFHGTVPSSYTTPKARFFNDHPSDTFDVFAQVRYVQSSSDTHWVFLLYDKNTKKIIKSYSAPDHPSYGQALEEDKIPHPFDEFWGKPVPSNLEIILLDNSNLDEVKEKTSRNKGILEVIYEEYEIDELASPIYKPRDIIELDQWGDKSGVVIKTYKNKTKYGKTITLKKRTISSLPSKIKYRKLKLK